MEDVISLSSLGVGEVGVISDSGTKSCADTMTLRLLDLGFCDGEEVCCVMESPAVCRPSSRAYLVKGSVIALRNSVSEGISVVPICTKEAEAARRRAYEN